MRNYDDPVISKTRKGIRTNTNQPVGIKIYGDGFCRNGADTCLFNGQSECHRCAIYSGDTKLPIKFSPVEKIESVDNLDQKIMVPSIKKEFTKEELIKPPIHIDAPKKIIEDVDDVSHYVKFDNGHITHCHSGSGQFHSHFLVEIMHVNCFRCGIPVIGALSCPACETIFNY